MKRVVGLAVVFMFIFGFYSPGAAQEEPAEFIHVSAVGCVDQACENRVDMFTVLGTVFTSYDAQSNVVDTCTSFSADDYSGCDLTPAPEGGVITIVPPAEYSQYSLLSNDPVVTDAGERGLIYSWYFVPPVTEEPAPTEVPAQSEMQVNAIACVDATCENTVDIYSLDGTVFTTYDYDGNVIDSCTVSSEATDFDGCVLLQHPSDGSITIVPPSTHHSYVLLSMEPTIFESEERGTVAVWYFVPPTANESEPVGTATPGQSSDNSVVTGLPDTGSGSVHGNGFLMAAVTGIVLIALGTTGVRKLVRQ